MFEQNGVLVEFKADSRESKAESRKRGRPVFNDIVVLEIVNPNDQTVRVTRVATNSDKITYRKAWQAFVNEQKVGDVEGTPLREWRVVTRAQAQEAAYYNILTVEQLAEADESIIADLGREWYELRTKAALYIQDSDAHASQKAVADENAMLREQVEAMQRQLAARAADETQERRKPGRPAKVQETETVEE